MTVQPLLEPTGVEYRPIGVSNTHQANQFQLKLSRPGVSRECVQTCKKCKTPSPVCLFVCVCVRALRSRIAGFLPGVALKMSHSLTCTGLYGECSVPAGSLIVYFCFDCRFLSTTSTFKQYNAMCSIQGVLWNPPPLLSDMNYIHWIN